MPSPKRGGRKPACAGRGGVAVRQSDQVATFGATHNTQCVKHKIIIISIVIVLGIIGGIFYYTRAEAWRHTFHVTFLNIGQGDSALIQFADGETMLVDCGPNSKVLSELGNNLPFYIHTIDYVLATHPDLDHYGGCVDVLRRYDVKHIIVNGRTKQDPYYKEWDKAMREETYEGAQRNDHPFIPSFLRRGHPVPSEIIVMKAPQTWTIASSTLQFLSPDESLSLKAAADDSNNYSIVFKLTSPTPSNSPSGSDTVGTESLQDRGSGPKTFLFTGDMEVPLEEALIQKYCATAVSSTGVGAENFLPLQSTNCPTLQSDILKVGHHGSNSSSGEDFLRFVKPYIAIISVGKNKFGHPSLRVMKHLERVGAKILRTDEVGDIVEK